MENDKQKLNISNIDIERINYLYNKENSPQNLTMEEQEEQALLRQKFMNYINENIKY